MNFSSKVVLFLALAILSAIGSQGNILTNLIAQQVSKIQTKVNAKSTLKTSSNINAVIDSSSSSTKCGGVLKGPSGTISYKPYTQIDENERCVWTIRTSRATRYAFTMTRLSLPYSVIISNVATTGSLSHYCPSSSFSSYTTSGTLAVITFYNTNRTGNGFILTYSTNLYGGNEGSTSQEVVAASNIGHIRHPANDSLANYANQDVSVFVFVPSCVNNFDNTTQVIYIRDGLEGTSCYDKLNLYRFDTTIASTSKWKSIGQICGGSVSEVISSRDLILVVFQSDGSRVNKGFHLYSMNT